MQENSNDGACFRTLRHHLQFAFDTEHSGSSLAKCRLASLRQVARRDYEYKRCGTADVFCGIEPKAGVHFTKVTPTRSSPEFADFLLSIAEHYPAAHTMHLVMDNLSTHTRKALVERFGEKDGGWLWERFSVQYTPKHGSWLNVSV